MFDKDTFIKIVKDYIQNNDITQEKFAQKINLQLSSVSRLLRRTNKSTSRPRKKTIKKIAEIIGIPESDFYKGFDGDPYKNSGINDLELKKYSSGNALEYIRLFNHENNRFLEPDYASDFDFEPIYKTEVDLVKKFLRTNDNI